jgi:hypothetical protein
VRPYLEKPLTKKGLVQWLKVKALSSSPSTAKQQQKNEDQKCRTGPIRGWILVGTGKVTRKNTGG